MAWRYVLWHRSNHCQVSLVRRWKLASFGICSKLLSSQVLQVLMWKSLRPNQSDLCLVMALWLGGYTPHLYSPELMTSDFHFFEPLKKNLTGKWFAAVADVKRAVISWLKTLYARLFYAKVQALVPWWDKCLNVDTNYVEVWYGPSATLCHVYTEVRMKFLVSECLLLFFTLLCISEYSADLSQPIRSLHAIGHWNIMCVYRESLYIYIYMNKANFGI